MPCGSRCKKLADNPKDLIPPPPHSLTGAGAAEVAANYTRAKALAATPHALPSPLHGSKVGHSVLEPHSCIDVVALIFILTSVPQGLSCFLLIAYILLNSFKNLAGKLLAKYFIRFDSGLQFDLESTCHSGYYRSELIGEFLQLFSINSFILLVCHYTMPHSWFQYLIVVAKSIIASRLIGSQFLSSNTYVSVVSSSSANPGVMVTTTTLCNGENPSQNRSNDFFARGFSKFFQGTLFVLATKYFIKTRLSNLNVAAVSHNIMLFYRNFMLVEDGPKYLPEDLCIQANSKAPASLQFFDSRQNDPTFHGFANSGILEKDVINLASNYIPIGRKTLGSLYFFSKEITTVINYAYLVLCIHVISLTISPLLKKNFISRTYSNTLDHLSSFTPDIPYGGFKRNGASSPSHSEALSDTPVVLNVEPALAQTAVTSVREMQEIQIDPSVANTMLGSDSRESVTSISAENFKVFCMSPSASLQISSGVKTGSKTTVDRKSTNNAIAPSTTIMDNLYSIAIQPLWSWIAAIKIIFGQPSLFSRPSSDFDQFLTSSALGLRMRMALFNVSENSILLEDLDESLAKSGTKNISVKVNEIDWPYYDFIPLADEKGNAYIRIYALSPLMEFSIDIINDGALVSNHLVVTPGARLETLNVSASKAVGTLQSSLLHAIQCLTHLKADFKKQKKDDNKRVADLRKKIDAMKSKIGKLGNKETSEVRVSGKLKGLQNSAHQLEAEIRDIERLIHEHEKAQSKFDADYIEEEKQLENQIQELETSIKESEAEVASLRAELKSVGSEKCFSEMKLNKVAAKLEEKEKESSRVKCEVKALRKALLLEIQRRKARVHERFDVIIPQIVEATGHLSQQGKASLKGRARNQTL